jgi:hypothetical protein
LGLDQLGHKQKPYLKDSNEKKAEGMAQITEHLPSKSKVVFYPPFLGMGTSGKVVAQGKGE